MRRYVVIAIEKNGRTLRRNDNDGLSSENAMPFSKRNLLQLHWQPESVYKCTFFCVLSLKYTRPLVFSENNIIRKQLHVHNINVCSALTVCFILFSLFAIFNCCLSAFFLIKKDPLDPLSETTVETTVALWSENWWKCLINQSRLLQLHSCTDSNLSHVDAGLDLLCLSCATLPFNQWLGFFSPFF